MISTTPTLVETCIGLEINGIFLRILILSSVESVPSNRMASARRMRSLIAGVTPAAPGYTEEALGSGRNRVS